MAVLFGRVMLKVSLSAIFMLTVLNCNITKKSSKDLIIIDWVLGVEPTKKYLINYFNIKDIKNYKT